MLVDVALAAFVLFARSSAPHPVIPAELLGSFAIAVAYATPAIAGWVARRGRPSLFVAAGLLAAALSITAFSLVTLVLLPPALLFLGAGGGPRGRRAAAIAAILVLPVIVVLLASGLFVVAWVVPIGLVVGALALLARHVGGAGAGTASVRILGGTVLVVGLAASAWLLPVANTTTICWASNGGSFTQTTEPGTAAGNGQTSVGSGDVGGPGGSAGPGIAGSPGGTTIGGPVGLDGSSGCDGGVPAMETSALSLLLSGACAVTALVVFPRTSDLPDA